MRVDLSGGQASFGVSQKVADAGELDDWRTLHLIVEGGRIEVRLDGAAIVELVDPDPLPAGRIALQHNRGRVAFRNVKVRRLAW
jgi:hypothetical protein